MQNYSIYENGDGGELFIQNLDIQKSGGLGVAAYLKLFGGNIEASTTGTEVLGELREDWWGNDTNDSSDTWINSETERVLKGVAITPAAIFEIEQAVLTDLDELKQFGDIDVSVTFPSLNRVQIDIAIKQVSQEAEILIVWDTTKNEIITERII